MMNDGKLHGELLHRFRRHHLQLILGHGAVRFIFDPLNGNAILSLANDTEKFDDRAGGDIGRSRRRQEFSFRQQNFTNGICHDFCCVAKINLASARRA